MKSKEISIEKRARVEILSIEWYFEHQIARKLQIQKMGCIIAGVDMQKPEQMLKRSGRPSVT